MLLKNVQRLINSKYWKEEFGVEYPINQELKEELNSINDDLISSCIYKIVINFIKYNLKDFKYRITEIFKNSKVTNKKKLYIKIW